MGKVTNGTAVKLLEKLYAQAEEAVNADDVAAYKADRAKYPDTFTVIVMDGDRELGTAVLSYKQSASGNRSYFGNAKLSTPYGAMTLGTNFTVNKSTDPIRQARKEVDDALASLEAAGWERAEAIPALAERRGLDVVYDA
jgi:hypothetical protein